MKKIIHGKSYDTETAQLMGEWDNEAYGKFEYCYEGLYRKRTGEFFLYGTGGPMSIYAHYVSYNETSGSSVIEPLTYVEAAQWAEEHLTGEEYAAIFGEPEEGNKRMVGVYISAKAEQLLNKAAASGKTKSAIVDELILSYL